MIEQRVSMNEEQVAQVQDYFKEVREQQQQQPQYSFPLAFNQNLVNQQYSQQLRQDIDQIKHNSY